MNPIDKCPKCGRDLVQMEYSWENPYHYDGVSEYFCPQPDQKSGKWHYRVGRWSNKLLKPGECEKPLGGKL